jgi:hypothetical protein
MFVYTFSGKVLPERANVHFPLPLDGTVMKEGVLGVGTRITLSVASSQLTAVVRSETRVDDLHGMKEKVEAYARFGVDALGFLLGCGYDVEITSVTSPDPLLYEVFGVDVPGASGAAGGSPEQIREAFQKLLQIPRDRQTCVRRALADFREAVRACEDTPFYCFRALEDLRQYFVAGEDRQAQKAWAEMGRQLALPEPLADYVQTRLRALAIPARHGQAREITAGERVEMLNATWQVIHAFVAAPLQPPEGADKK